MGEASLLSPLVAANRFEAQGSLGVWRIDLPVHRRTLIAVDELAEAEQRLAQALGDLEAEVRERDVERSLAALDDLRRRADELEQTLLRVQR